MIELPLRAFCFMGINGEDKIEMTIDEVFGFPEQTSHEGGYDFKGSLIIRVGCYKVHSEDFYSSTGILFNLNTSLVKCYNSLHGTAVYKHLLENNLIFELKMAQHGHAIIDGEFREYLHLPNSLCFQIETDQTCILSCIDDLNQVEWFFGDNKGNHASKH